MGEPPDEVVVRVEKRDKAGQQMAELLKGSRNGRALCAGPFSRAPPRRSVSWSTIASPRRPLCRLLPRPALQQQRLAGVAEARPVAG